MYQSVMSYLYVTLSTSYFSQCVLRIVESVMTGLAALNALQTTQSKMSIFAALVIIVQGYKDIRIFIDRTNTN